MLVFLAYFAQAALGKLFMAWVPYPDLPTFDCRRHAPAAHHGGLGGHCAAPVGTSGMPLGCYTFLRIAVCASAIYQAWNGHKHGLGPWITVAFVLVAFLYNPVLPVYLGPKAAWAPVNFDKAVL
jgi:hypothetical protein